MAQSDPSNEQIAISWQRSYSPIKETTQSVKSFFTSKSVNDNNNIPSRTISVKEVVTEDGVAIGKGSVQDELDGGDEGKIYAERDTSLGSLNPKKRPLDALSKQSIYRCTFQTIYPKSFNQSTHRRDYVIVSTERIQNKFHSNFG
jgi:hypothetical protein